MLAVSGYKTSHDEDQWPARPFAGVAKKAERKARQFRTRKRSDDLRNVLSTYDDSCAEKRRKLPKDDLRWVIDSGYTDTLMANKAAIENYAKA
jgi:hypothetical protein